MTSPRSIIVKPSQFGIIGNTNEDFDEIYENPLDKSKPLPPKLSENSSDNFEGDSTTMRGKSKDKEELSWLITKREENEEEKEKDNNKINHRSREKRNIVSRSMGNTNDAFEEKDIEKRRDDIIEEKTKKNNNNKKDSSNKIIDERRREGGERNDTNLDIANVLNSMKSLDVNRYATKKTIAQGMLDIALLTANASQLKYILQVGRQHEFYILMLSLICVSIGLQILSGLLSLSLNLMNDCKMEDNSYARSVELVGKARVLLSFVVFIDNLFIATFDPTGLSSLLNSDTASVVGILYAVVGGLNINRSKDHKAALILNDLILIGVFLISLINVIISGFGMGHDNGNSGFYDHGKQSTRSSTTESDNVIQGIVCVLLGSSLNINKQQDQRKANVWNNICLIMMVLTVAVNAVISAFDMRDTPGNIVNSTNGATTITLDSSGLR